MAEYLKIVNDDGHILIDDSYQNYHFMNYREIDCTTLPHYSTGAGGNQLQDSGGFNFWQYIFTVNGVKKPLVAYRAVQQGDQFIASVTYTETSPSNWTVKVMVGSNNGVLKMYLYGLLPQGTQPSTGAVFQVKGANGELIFDSGRKPLVVKMFVSKMIPYSWNSTAVKPPFVYTIPNYDPSRKYAIVPCTNMYSYAYYNPNFFYYSASTTAFDWNDLSKVQIGHYVCGVNNIMGNTDFPTMVSYSHGAIIIDVTTV